MSDTGIEKFRAEETVRLSYFKHRGDLHRIVKETGYPVEYVKKITAKIKKKRNRDVDFHIAAAVSTEIMSGHESRVAHIRMLISRIEAEAEQSTSRCCGAPVRVHTFDDEKHFFCENCNTECKVNFPKNNINEYMKLLKMWTAEDASLADFAAKMGLTFLPEAPVVKQNNFFIHGGKAEQIESTTPKQIPSTQLDEDGKEIITEAGELDPRSRERLRKRLESRVIDALEGTKLHDSEPTTED